WFFGGGIKYHKFNFLFSRDINGRSKGSKASLRYTAMYPLGEKIFTISSVGLEYFNRDFAEYYYGVKSIEANANRAEYHPNAYVLPVISFFPGYKLSEEINVLIGTSLKTLPKPVRASPTTNGAWLEGSMIFGATWKF
ncbi:MAG: MipA/OmpV family protein, partial [Bacteriovorax sp.]|nr:MipA/OmpV family protein [Bacteriovorax sp.]